MTDTPERVACLHEAAELTTGDRQKDYGDPVQTHQHIASVFNAITKRDLTASEVALMQQCTKMVRRWNSPRHRDSYVDAAAYVGIEYECALAEDEENTS